MKKHLLLWGLVLPLACLMTSCLYRGHAVVVVGDEPGPVVAYDYWYYPAWGVYYDYDAHVYFYLNGSTWVRVAHLPRRYHNLGGYVVVESERGRPWTRYEDHRAKYPPGQWKKDMREGDQGRGDEGHGRNHKHHFEDDN